jgi:acetyl esterase/lipase
VLKSPQNAGLFLNYIYSFNNTILEKGRMRGVLAVISLGVCLIAPAARAQVDEATSKPVPPHTVSYPGGVTSLRDVAFHTWPGFRPLTLDLYLPPAGGAPKPVVVFIHGGSWNKRTARDGGSFRDFPAVLASVAARGYVVASVNYRLSGEVRFPGAILDVKQAVRWLRQRADEYNADADKVVVWGSSAGGQIATVIGASCGVAIFDLPSDSKSKAPPSDCVQGVIDWYGLIDLQSTPHDIGKAPVAGQVTAAGAYLGCEPDACPDTAKAASPLAYLDAKDPPVLIQHGEADTSVSPKQARKFYDALRAAKVPAELVVYPGADHGFTKPDGGPHDAVNQQALDKVFAFLEGLFPKPR